MIPDISGPLDAPQPVNGCSTCTLSHIWIPHPDSPTVAMPALQSVPPQKEADQPSKPFRGLIWSKLWIHDYPIF